MLAFALNAARLAALGLLLTACGTVQSVTDSTSSVASRVFYKQIKTLHLDFDGRVALNTAGSEPSGFSVPTLVRIYQLRDGKSLNPASYEELLRDADRVLGDGVLDQRSLVVRPGEGVQLNMPMDSRAQVIAVVALFREPDLSHGTWRLTLSRDDLDPDNPRVIELAGNGLTLRPMVGG
jgi:type VI secretion system protein VasD